MAKEKSMKPQLNVVKKRKPNSIASEVQVEEVMDTKVKKKKMQVEEVPVQIPHVTNTSDDKKHKKEKKRKKKQMKEQIQKTQEIEISHPPKCPEGSPEPEGEDLSPEEKRVLERKVKKMMKKEQKKKLKEEGKTPEKTDVAAPSAPQQALDYLSCWAENRTQWKFQKIRQTWLLQNMFDAEKVPDDKFPLLLQYLEGLRGGAIDTTVKKALVLVEESGQAPEDTAVQQRAHRAREVIQLLS